MLYPEFLWKDRHFSDSEVLPCEKGIRIQQNEDAMFGYAYLPGGSPDQRHPCVICLHGLPGYTTNQDIAHALRRMGFVVLNPFYRGAWGSQGWFTLSGMVEDVTAVVNWCQSHEALEDYGIDGNNVFLLGISMGGWAAINGLCRCPKVKGAIALAPADIECLEREQPQLFQNAYNKYGCLHIESPQTLVQDASLHREDMGLLHLTDALRNRPLLLIGGGRDSVVPPDRALVPFWEALSKQDATGCKQFEILDTGHSFADCRMALTQRIAQWLLDRI